MHAVDSSKSIELTMKHLGREEHEIWSDLANLATSPGFIHAMAYVSNRDNVIKYSGEMKTTDLESQFGWSRFIRTEVNTLLGLMCRAPVDVTQPSKADIAAYVTKAEALMAELHDVMNRPSMQRIHDAIARATDGSLEELDESEVWTGDALREPIFYGAESAYTFQYRDLVTDKYGKDDPWFIANMGFSIQQAKAMARAMCDLVDEKGTVGINLQEKSGSEPDSWLATFTLTIDEVAFKANVPDAACKAFFQALTLTGTNETFQTLGDYNEVTARPLIPIGESTVCLFSHYGIYEALYESPFFWMLADRKYKATAAANRGDFTERFAAQRLRAVFGFPHVHINVNVVEGKANIIGEADVLVVYGDRLIVVQCKAKKLTLEARKGNDGQLRKDFAAAIQDSYDQGWTCANAILAGMHRLVGPDGLEVELPRKPKEIFIFNVVSEHYPALAFQTRQYLKYQETERIRPPFVMDVFLLDAMTEMLSSPLRLLSYVKLRLATLDKVLISHELTALSYHLRRNLWLDSKHDMVSLDDTIAMDLDTAMIVRREGIPGPRTPPGILTSMAGTLFERLISQLEQEPDTAAIEAGFELLSVSEEAARNINGGLDFITNQSRRDGRRHDFSIGTDGDGGLCFHCNPVQTQEAIRTLQAHCVKRKYKTKSDRWFGVSVDPNTNVQFGVSFMFPWEYDATLERETAGMKDGAPAPAAFRRTSGAPSQAKQGRNEPCACGSGKKFKRCCLQ